MFNPIRKLGHFYRTLRSHRGALFPVPLKTGRLRNAWDGCEGVSVLAVLTRSAPNGIGKR